MAAQAFGPFRLDPAQRLLTRPGAEIVLRPKTLDVLLLLLRRRGEVVTKAEILASVWEGVAVSEYVLTTCISELRAALGDRGREPRWVRTVHGTGYRLTVDDDPASLSHVAEAAPMVGRDRELARLQAALRRGRAGRRQVIFVTGEMGIGKTTLAGHFLASAGSALVARGQCIEQFGPGEPYMPVLEALGRLGRSTGDVAETMRRHAPAWLAHVPGLLPPEQRAALRRETPPDGREAMLRQLADVLEALCERRELVLLLEDLHLSDHATLELLAALALRTAPAHLVIVGTFRAAEAFPASAGFQRLKQQLLLHAQCEEIALGALPRDAIDAYLATRFAGLTLPAGLAATITQRTDGNPLFVARLVDHLVDDEAMTIDRGAGAVRLRDADVADRVPQSLRAMIEERADALADDERATLDAASVAGVELWSGAVATALGRDLEDVERLCGALARRHGLLVPAPDPDADRPALGARWAFTHGLHRQVVYERLEPTRRRRLHRAIGAALRDAWGDRAGESAAELASHFERGGDAAAAIGFFDLAASTAAGRGANREAVGYLDRALALLEPDAASRRLDLLMTRGPAVLATSGYGSADVLDTYGRALELARGQGDAMREMSCLLALSTCRQTRGELVEGEALARALVDAAERLGLPAPLRAQLHNPLSQARMYRGAVEESLALADAAVAGLRVFAMPPPPPGSRPAVWADPGVMLWCQYGAVSYAAGRFAQAAVAVEESLRIARALGHPFNLASACTFVALWEDTTGRWERAIAVAREAIETARAHDVPFWRGIAQIICGHAMVRGGDVDAGLALLRDGIAVWSATGARLATSNHRNLLADACLAAGDVDGARAALEAAAAHAEETGERVFLAETWRLQAACRPADADALLSRAIDLARAQGTRLWELRATLDRHRLRGTADTRRALAAVLAGFDGEPDSADVQEARRAVGPDQACATGSHGRRPHDPY